jgi:hypothetical protein
MMFKKITRLAEGLATNVSASRRGFLGRVGQAALGVAGAIGALAITATAGSGDVVCCKYNCTNSPYRHRRHVTVCQPAGTTCAPSPGCQVVTQTVSDCSKC